MPALNIEARDVAAILALFGVMGLAVLAGYYRSYLPDALQRRLFRPLRWYRRTEGPTVRFRFDNKSDFAALQALLSRLNKSIRLVRAGEVSEEDYFELEQWQNLLPTHLRSNFVWPTPEEVTNHRELWDSMVVRLLPPASYLGRQWHFDEILYWLLNSEYNIYEAIPLHRKAAELRLRMHAYPYGGLGAPIGLIEGFGFKVIGAADLDTYSNIP